MASRRFRLPRPRGRDGRLQRFDKCVRAGAFMLVPLPGGEYIGARVTDVGDSDEWRC